MACVPGMLIGPQMEPAMTSQDELASNLEQMQARYIESLIAADTYVREHGGRFFNFLQPTVFTSTAGSEYEAMLIQNDRLLMHASATAYNLGYPLLREAVDTTRSLGVGSYDLTELFNTRRRGEEFYLDYVHVNHAANERIARSMLEGIFGAAHAP